MSKSNKNFCSNLRFICIICVLNVLSVDAQQVLTLEQCRELALKNNEKIKNANLSVEIAKQQKKEAFTKYFPSVSATGMGFMANKPMLSMEMDLSEMMQPMITTFAPITDLLAQLGITFDLSALSSLSQPQKIEMLKNGIIGSVTATQPLFAGGQIVNGNRLAQVGVEVSQIQRNISENEVLLNTESYFWTLVSLKEKLKTIDNSSVMLKQIFDDVKIAVEAGLTTNNDLLRVEIEQNTLAGNKLKVENTLNILKMSFAQYIGLDNEDFDVVTPNLETGNPILTAANDLSVENRPEYQLLNKSVEAAKLKLDMEYGKIMPTVAIGAGYNYMHFDMNKDNGTKNNFGMLFATVSIPITDWWGGSHAIKREKLAYLTAQNQMEATSDLLRIQLQQFRNEVNEAYEQTLLAKKSITASENNLNTAQDNYSAGLITLSELLEAQNLLQQARDNFTEAMKELQIANCRYSNAVSKTSGGGDRTLGGGDRTLGGGDRTLGGGDKTSGGGDKTSGGGDRSSGGGDRTLGGGDKTLGGGDRN
ncbi:MAG: TolC family protein [Bacteroidales bacterium]|jgi:outer membrane protein TolC|nr:TolC family protein [Bacteroidales bacterium]